MADTPTPPPWPATAVVTGHGRGRPLLLDQALSFWGGYDAATGRIIEAGHPQIGMGLAGRVMLMARGKGSSSSSSVLAEAIRNGTGPAAIIMRERDLIVGLGCIVASELYGLDVPVLVVTWAIWDAMQAQATGSLSVWSMGTDQCGDCVVQDMGLGLPTL